MKRMTVLSIVALLALLFFAAPATSVRAAGFLRVIPVGGSESGTCNSWGTACTLQYALQTAAAFGDEIWVRAGTYKPGEVGDRTVTFQLKTGVVLYGGFIGTETNASARNPAANPTILSGDLDGDGRDNNDAYHVVTGSGVGMAAVLDGFTITGGNATGVIVPNIDGGGIYNVGGNPTLRNLNIESNFASGDGGGMFNDSSSAPTLENVTFYQNEAHSGGGMANRNSRPTLTNLTFSGNTAMYGGGMSLSSSSDPQMKHVTFSGNTAEYFGGALDASEVSLTIHSTIFWGDTAPTGPEISLRDVATAVLDDCVIQGGSWGSDNRTSDPLLGALGTYGGSVRVYPLLPSSSAIDFATTEECPTTDARGKTRPWGSWCDSGAFESQGFHTTLFRFHRCPARRAAGHWSCCRFPRSRPVSHNRREQQ